MRLPVRAGHGDRGSSLVTGHFTAPDTSGPAESSDSRCLQTSLTPQFSGIVAGTMRSPRSNVIVKDVRV